METIISIDIKIAEFLKRSLNYYIKKRTPSKTKKDKIWLSNFSCGDSFIKNLNEELKIKLYKDSILCRLIFFEFEVAELTFVQRFLRKGDIFLDIGANIGLFSLYASKAVGETGLIYSFEPTPSTYYRLEENIILNKIRNIKPINIGLSNQRMLMEFYISNNGYDAWNSLAKLERLKSGSVININVETLDSFIAENNLNKVDLIKLDVEGWEKFILEGAVDILKRDDAPVFLVEFTEENAFSAGYYCGEMFDYMKYFGYNWYSYNPTTNILKEEIKKLHYPYENLIAVKNFDDCSFRINTY